MDLTPSRRQPERALLLPFEVQPGLFSAVCGPDRRESISQVTQTGFAFSPVSQVQRLDELLPDAARILDAAGVSLSSQPSPNVIVNYSFKDDLRKRLIDGAGDQQRKLFTEDNWSNTRLHSALAALVAEALVKDLLPNNEALQHKIIRTVYLHDADKRLERECQKIKQGLDALYDCLPTLVNEAWHSIRERGEHFYNSIAKPTDPSSGRIVQILGTELCELKPDTARQIVESGTATSPGAFESFVVVTTDGKLVLDVHDLAAVIVRVCDDATCGPDFNKDTGLILTPGDRALVSGFYTANTHAWMREERIVVDHEIRCIKKVSAAEAGTFPLNSYVAGDFTQSMNRALLQYLKTLNPKWQILGDDFVVQVARSHIASLH